MIDGATRRREILRRIAERGVVRVADEARRLGVTTMTVRRDLDLLETRGVLVRTHGGAVLPDGVRRGVATPDGRYGRVSRDRRIGLLLPARTVYFREIEEAARLVAEERGFELRVQFSGYERAAEAAIVEDFVRQRVPAVAIATAGGEDDEVGRMLRALDSVTAAVFIERRPPRGPRSDRVDAVYTDHERGGGLAIEHLIERGYRSVMFVSVKSPTSRWLTAGFEEALARTPLRRLDPRALFAASDPAEIRARLRRAPAPAVFAHSDAVALRVQERLAALGMNSPDDVGLISYDDELASLARPPLSAIAPPRAAMGRAAIELLERRLATPEAPGRRLSLTPGLHARGSTVRLDPDAGGNHI